MLTHFLRRIALFLRLFRHKNTAEHCLNERKYMYYDDYGEDAAGEYDQDYDEDEHYYGAESYQVVR